MHSTCGTGTGCGGAGTPLASYACTLGAAGNRLSVAELSGRTVTYGYDDLYRLTSETIGADPHGNNGQVSYTFDNVGNRLQRNSSLGAIPATGLLNYDANDRTATDPYDANGNLLNGGVGSNIYDFENHMVAAGGASLVYDGDGNRVKETVAGVATSYLVADQNLTGYAQVLDELQNGSVSRTYSYGLSLISQKLTANGQGLSFYGYDGHGSVRFLTSTTGAITDSYDYDVYRVNIDGGSVERLTQGNGFATALRVSADGRTAVFLKWRLNWRKMPVQSTPYLLDIKTHKTYDPESQRVTGITEISAGCPSIRARVLLSTNNPWRCASIAISAPC